MTTDDAERLADPTNRNVTGKVGSLLQIVRELEGLLKLSDVVPTDLLWDRPPGLPSGAELLWLVRLVDEHVFSPAIFENRDALPIDQPDYAGLLAAYPCPSGSLDKLVTEITASREQLIATLEESAGKIPLHVLEKIVVTVLEHDRHVLSAFTERLYESGLGT